MGEEHDFDVIIVGAGFGGAATALGLISKGVEGSRILLLDRGDPIGAKNLCGGVLWGRDLDDFLPLLGDWEKDGPFESYVNRVKVGLLSPEDSILLEGRFSSWDGTDQTSEPTKRTGWTVLRARTDKWLAEKLESLGVVVVPGVRIDQLHIEGVDPYSYDPLDLTLPASDSNKGNAQKFRIDNNPELAKKLREGRIMGVVQDGEVTTAKVVVIASGSNSVLSRCYGFDDMMAAQRKDDMLIGIKEVIHLGEEVMDSRFLRTPATDESLPSGMALEVAAGIYEGLANEAWNEYPETKGMVPRAGGFLYTNKDTLSVGLVIQLASMPEGIHVYDMLEVFKQHPAIAPLISGGKVLEYGAHLVPEFGLSRQPEKLVRDGGVLVGEAAGLVYSNGMVIQGMNYALHSGKLAGYAIADSLTLGDYSEKGLKSYKKLLDSSFIMRDLHRFKHAAKTLSDEGLFTWLPQVVARTLNRTFRELGEEKRSILRTGLDVRKELRKDNVTYKRRMGWPRLLRFGWKAKGL